MPNLHRSLQSVSRNRKKCHGARLASFYDHPPSVWYLPIEEILWRLTFTQGSKNWKWCIIWSRLDLISPGISTSLIVPLEMKRLWPRRLQVGLVSWDIACARNLAMLQARPHIGVTSQYTMLWKLHKSCMRYLEKVMYKWCSCVAETPVGKI